jgi:protein phosphatase 1 regulatory subunit 11
LIALFDASTFIVHTIKNIEKIKIHIFQRSPAVKLKLKKPKNDRKVKWTEGTVDNEHLDKKKSKCQCSAFNFPLTVVCIEIFTFFSGCCIYEKPKLFGESSEEDDDDECGHCRGHKKKCYQSKPPDHDSGSPGPGAIVFKFISIHHIALVG